MLENSGTRTKALGRRLISVRVNSINVHSAFILGGSTCAVLQHTPWFGELSAYHLLFLVSEHITPFPPASTRPRQHAPKIANIPQPCNRANNFDEKTTKNALADHSFLFIYHCRPTTSPSQSKVPTSTDMLMARRDDTGSPTKLNVSMSTSRLQQCYKLLGRTEVSIFLPVCIRTSLDIFFESD